MKKRKMVLFLLPLLLVGCSKTGTDSENGSASKDSGTNNSQGSTIEKYLEKNEEFYKIDSDFKVSKDETVMITGYDSKSVYIGQDEKGYDTKVMFYTSYQKKLSPLEENAPTEVEQSSFYYSPTKKYEKLSDGTYKTSDYASDIKPMSLSMDFSKVDVLSDEKVDSTYLVKGSVEDGKVSSFLKNTIQDSSSVKSLNVQITFEKASLALDEVKLTYELKGFSVSQTLTYSTLNSRISLPSVS